MHEVEIRPEIIERVMARRGRVNFFEDFDANTTALIVIDMQNLFCEEGGPGEVPMSRAIVPNINKLAAELRKRDVPVFWVLHANMQKGGKSDWDMFYNHVVSGEIRSRTLESNSPETQAVYSELETDPADITLIKNRYSAFTPGSSSLERVLRSMGIEHLLIAGTKSNVCCESTARDGMMLDFKVTMLSDCCAALSDDEHRAAMENIIQQFGNVLNSEEVLAIMDKN